MSAADLMLKPVPELAALVRGGEISAREVVGAALRRIEDLDDRINAFVEVDAERRARGRRQDRARRRAPVRRRADRDQVQRAGRRHVHELRLEVPRGPPAGPQRLHGAPAARGRVRRRRHDEHAGVRDPADDRAPPHRRDPQPVEPRPHAGRLVGRRGRGGGVRHAAGGARQRRRRLAPHPGRVLRAGRPQAEPRPRLARAGPRRLVPRVRRRADADRRRDRAAARRAGRLRGRRRDLGAAADRAVRDVGAARPRPPARGDDRRQPARRRRRPRVRARHARRGRAALLARPRGRARLARAARAATCSALFIQAFGPQVSLGIGYGELLAGRPPEEDEIEPLSRAIYDLAREPAVGRLPRRGRRSCRRSRAASWRSSPSTTCCSRRRSPSARWRSASAPASARTRWPTCALRAASRRSRRCSTSPGQPAISVPLGFGDDGLPTAAQLVAKPLGEDTLLQVAAQMEAALGRPAQVPDL